MRFDTDFEYDEWSEKKRAEQIHKDTQLFRSKKIGEIFSKEKPTELEIEFVNRWASTSPEEERVTYI